MSVEKQLPPLTTNGGNQENTETLSASILAGAVEGVSNQVGDLISCCLPVETLEFLWDLTRLGVPIVRGWRGSDNYDQEQYDYEFYMAVRDLEPSCPKVRAPKEFSLPPKWETSDVSDNASSVCQFDPGEALLAVMKHDGPLALVDVDVKHGACIEDVLNVLRDIDVTIYAGIETPGKNGRHFYVAGSPDLQSVRLDKLDSLPGVEILIDRKGPYLPGTVRPKYGKGYKILFNNLQDLLDNPERAAAEGQRLAEYVKAHAVKRTRNDTDTVGNEWDGKPHTPSHEKYLAKVLESEISRVLKSVPGEQNNELNTAAFILGRWIAGEGLDEEMVRDKLLEAATKCGYVARDGEDAALDTIDSGISDGKTKPKNIPPAAPSLDIPGGKPSAATLIVELALNRYRFGVSDDGATFAVEPGKHVVRTLRGAKNSLRAELSREYFRKYKKAAPQQALADALLVLEGEAQEADPERLHIRVAKADGALWVDMGDTEEKVIRIADGQWSIVDTAPVLFQRTALTGVIPDMRNYWMCGMIDDPVMDDWSLLWDHLNVSVEDRPLIMAWLIAAIIQPDAPHAILSFHGEQGTGKTTATKRLVSVVDPSPVPIRKAPKDEEAWVTAAAGSWVVALDNMSSIPPWLSDSLCRGSTGDGDVRRVLYSDSDLKVFAFRRVIALNGIDVGAMKGDLAERMVSVELDRISEEARMDEEEIEDAWVNDHPYIVAALLSTAAIIQNKIPSVRLDRKPRMADFAKVVTAVDNMFGTNGYERYTRQSKLLADDALTSDSLMVALVNYSKLNPGVITGTSSAVLAALTGIFSNGLLPHDWPKSAREVTGRLTRNAVALRTAGWSVERMDRGGHSNAIGWCLTPPSNAAKAA